MAKSILDAIDILNDYSQDIQEEMKNIAKQTAKDSANKLKSTSPKDKRNTARRGKYAKGWRIQTNENKYSIECTIHNATDYQLTHLLEKGHLTRNGKRVPAQVHIKPVEEEAVKTYEKQIEDIIKNGG